MIVAYTRIDKLQDVLIKEINKNEFVFEYRYNLIIVSTEKFKTFIGAEKFYATWIQSLFEKGGDYE